MARRTACDGRGGRESTGNGKAGRRGDRRGRSAACFRGLRRARPMVKNESCGVLGPHPMHEGFQRIVRVGDPFVCDGSCLCQQRFLEFTIGHLHPA